MVFQGVEGVQGVQGVQTHTAHTPNTHPKHTTTQGLACNGPSRFGHGRTGPSWGSCRGCEATEQTNDVPNLTSGRPSSSTSPEPNPLLDPLDLAIQDRRLLQIGLPATDHLLPWFVPFYEGLLDLFNDAPRPGHQDVISVHRPNQLPTSRAERALRLTDLQVRLLDAGFSSMLVLSAGLAPR